MASVADALRAFAPAFYDRYGDHIPLSSRKVLDAIKRCRTGQLGGVKYECSACSATHWTGRSCGNRHCPNCQFEKTQVWLAKQTANLLPVHHFCVTFTVPSELRMTLRSRKADGYEALFAAAADSLRDVASATRSLKDSQLGFFGVLHTWGRDPMLYILDRNVAFRSVRLVTRPQRTARGKTSARAYGGAWRRRRVG